MEVSVVVEWPVVSPVLLYVMRLEVEGVTVPVAVEIREVIPVV
jgi:hypothetical protein